MIGAAGRQQVTREAALPPVLIALAFQRYLVAGLVSGAVKG